MPNHKQKSCVVCGISYTPTGPCSKYCGTNCASVLKPQRQKIYNRRSREKRGLPVGVGKGGNTRRFTDDSQYSTGIGNFHRLRRHLRSTIKHCQRCGKDLSEAKRHEWCTHHKDHDRTNNVLENLEILCKSCHQTEHECWKHLNK